MSQTLPAHAGRPAVATRSPPAGEGVAVQGAGTSTLYTSTLRHTTLAVKVGLKSDILTETHMEGQCMVCLGGNAALGCGLQP
jgi:hypothetical protein